MNFDQQWMEYDYNPFILFSSNGKVISLNSQAQFLMGCVTTQELFSIATAYANISFGFKTTFLDLTFGRYRFFAITVGYEDDEKIGIKLYQSPTFKLNKPKPIGELANIYALVDLCISTHSINSKTIFIKDFDPTIPEVIIDSNSFIKTLTKAYGAYENSEKISTKIFYRVGEHIKFEDKKYSIFSIEISGKNLMHERVDELKLFAVDKNFYIDFEKKITINIPMITL
jgi:hypothetical protein